MVEYHKAKGENDKALEVYARLAEDALQPEDFDLASQVVISPACRVKY